MHPPLKRRRVSEELPRGGEGAVAALPISTVPPVPSFTEEQSSAPIVGSTSTLVESNPQVAETTVALAPSFSSVMRVMGKLIKPIYRDLEATGDERKKLTKTLELKRNLLERQKEDIKGLEKERDKALGEWDQAVINLSVIQKELEESRERVLKEVERGRALEEEVLKANSDCIRVEGKLDHLKGQHNALQKDYVGLKDAAEKAKASTAEWSGKYEDL